MDATNAPATGFFAKVANVIQWIVFAFCALILTVIVSDIGKRDVPGAPLVELYVAIAVASIVALAHLPPIFTRFPRKVKWGAYAAIVVMFLLFGKYAGDMAAAYDRTPEGAKVAAARAKDEAESAARQDAEKKVAEAKDAAQHEQAAQEKVKGCLSWGGEISAFSKEVKESLHNPDSFQHVKTEVTDPDYDGRNAQMIFRAENGFGAIRTGRVSAKITEDCSVVDMGKLELE